MCVASSSRRKTLPGATMRIGGGPASIVRICTGDVCERRMRPPSTKNVSCMSRAGWSGGVLSASKLFHSVSIHGPVRTSKPRPRKISSISRRTSVSGCSVPSGAAARRQRHVDDARQIGRQARLVERRQPLADGALDAATWRGSPPRPPPGAPRAAACRAPSSARRPSPSCPGSAPGRARISSSVASAPISPANSPASRSSSAMSCARVRAGQSTSSSSASGRAAC